MIESARAVALSLVVFGFIMLGFSTFVGGPVCGGFGSCTAALSFYNVDVRGNAAGSTSDSYTTAYTREYNGPDFINQFVQITSLYLLAIGFGSLVVLELTKPKYLKKIFPPAPRKRATRG